MFQMFIMGHVFKKDNLVLLRYMFFNLFIFFLFKKDNLVLLRYMFFNLFILSYLYHLRLLSVILIFEQSYQILNLCYPKPWLSSRVKILIKLLKHP